MSKFRPFGALQAVIALGISLPAVLASNASTSRHASVVRGLEQQLLDAAVDGDFSRVKALVAKGVSVKDGRELLIVSYTGQTESGYHPFSLVRFLVEHGANVNYGDEDGNSPLMEAASTGSVRTVQYLLVH